LLRGLEGETDQVIALEEGLSVVSAAGQGLQVEAGEGVAADVEELRVF
jgi:hypothetical protein